MILVDTCVIIDILTDDPIWYDWSSFQLFQTHETLCINPIVFGELAVKSLNIDVLDESLAKFKRLPLPYEAAFLAGKAFDRYKNKQKGQKISPLSDFFIGAHAATSRMKLLTRDLNRYQTYFPEIQLIHPYQ